MTGEPRDRDPELSPRGTIRLEQLPGGLVELRLEGIQIQVESGPDRGRKLTLCLPLIRIGSGPENDLVLTDPTVSSFHAEVEPGELGIVLRDRGSTNGSFVGELRITEAVLPPGTRCRLGDTVLSLGPRTESRRSLVLEEERLGELVGRTLAMRRVFSLLRTLAPTPASVLLQGESGTGKELAARALHELSGRSGPLVVFDAGAADPAFLRSDLLGHLKGAFTGAAEARLGAFRRAHRGTLFIDELGELPLELQPHLLRVLETRQVTPVGADESHPVDVRLVVATNRDLEAEVRAGRFRRDLFHRVAVAPIALPPLRERIEDLEVLAAHLLSGLGLGCRPGPRALEVLRSYPWPGNVRELRNVLERAGYLAGAGEILPDHLHLPGQPAGPDGAATGPRTIEEVERRMILEAVDRHGDDKEAAARELGISIATLRRRLRDYRQEP